ncbi:MAG: hypothetical protein JW929_13215 [Anaerolineales bacterium]|nr:hypothetical protein [Anaerolineales bacterium]
MAETKLTPFSYFDLLDACALPGCPVCRLEAKIVGGYLDVMLYENVNDPDAQAALRRSKGYCHAHSWLLTKISASPALGVAILYRQAAQEVLETLGSPKNGESPPGDVRIRRKSAGVFDDILGRLNPKAQCPACAHRDKMIEFILKTMLEALDRVDDRMQSALSASGGLCLPHLRRALEMSKSQTTSDFLRRQAGEKLSALIGELNEFIRKNDYRFAGEGMGKEGDSWRRILAWMAGEQ